MSSTKQHIFDNSNNSKKEIKRKKSYFWNKTSTTKCATIDNKNLSEKGQVRDKSCSSNDKPTTNFFAKLYKRMNSALTKPSLTSSAAQRSGDKVRHTRSAVEMRIDNRNTHKTLRDSNTRSIHHSENSIKLPSPPYITNDRNELNDWKTTLLNELDATRYGNSYKNPTHSRHYDNSDSNELVINTLQPSGMDNNRKANHHFLDEKLGVISKKAMIDDWLHYNTSIPDSANTNYLQQNDKLFSKRQISSQNEGESLLSAQLKKQGKKKHDHIKEKLDIAAARRNEIKTNRLREQMDTAVFETMHMLRENDDINNKRQFNVEDLLFNDDRKGKRKDYLSTTSDATSSSSLSNDYYLYNNRQLQQHQEDVLIW